MNRGVLRGIENLLMVIGATSLGIATCGIGLVCLLAVTAAMWTRPGAEPGTQWGVAFAALWCGGCGGVLGAVAGLVVALRWISRRDNHSWNLPIWSGIGIGIAAGLTTWFGRLREEFGDSSHPLVWITFVVVLGSGGTLAGIVGSFVAKALKPPPRKGPRIKRLQIPEESDH